MSTIINPDILALKESSTLKINQTARKLRASGETVYHYGFGQSPFPVHPKVVEKLKENAHQKDYLATQGLEELRSEIANWYEQNYDYNFNSGNVIIGPGSKELIFQALFVLEGPVIIPAPSWVSYGPQVNIRGKHITRVITKKENSYKITAEELDEVCSHIMEGQKAIVINSPNNPTGAVYSDSEIEAIAKVCKQHNVIIISDEIYGLIDWSGEKKKGFYHYYPEGTIITGGLSKSHSAGGYRLGYMVVSEHQRNVINCMISLISETYSSVCAPIQFASIPAYSNDPEIKKYVDDCGDIHKLVGLYMAKRFRDMGADCVDPQGAFYLFPDFTPHKEKLKQKFNIETSIDWGNFLMEKLKIAMLPGTDFYYPEELLCMRVATVDYEGETAYNAYKNGEKRDEAFLAKYCPSVVEGLNVLEKFLKEL